MTDGFDLAVRSLAKARDAIAAAARAAPGDPARRDEEMRRARAWWIDAFDTLMTPAADAVGDDALASVAEGALRIEDRLSRTDDADDDATAAVLEDWETLSWILLGGAAGRIARHVAPWPADPAEPRRRLLSALEAQPRAAAGDAAALAFLCLPRPMVDGLVDALRALDHGEVQPLLAPKATGEHGAAWTEMNLKLLAVELTRFHHGCGMQLQAARADIAAAFGAGSPATVKSWETTELRRKFDDLDERLVIAELAGRLHAHARRHGPTDAVRRLAEEGRELRSPFDVEGLRLLQVYEARQRLMKVDADAAGAMLRRRETADGTPLRERRSRRRS
jgi:hypothetical protein